MYAFLFFFLALPSLFHAAHTYRSLKFYIMSQRTCTKCAHHRPLDDFRGANSTRVLNMCARCRVCSAFYFTFIVILFTDFVQASASSRRRPLHELDLNAADNPMRRSKQARTTTSRTAIPPSPSIQPPVFPVPSALAPIEHISAPSHPPAQPAVFRAFSVVAQTAETVRPFLSIRHDTC